jgi:membrane associated rhomboid family serine protease
VIPLRDTIPSRTAPVVTVALIAVNVLVFVHETALGPYLPQFIEHYGLVPYVFVHWGDQFGNPLDPARFLPLFTSMFWHGGWATCSATCSTSGSSGTTSRIALATAVSCSSTSVAGWQRR